MAVIAEPGEPLSRDEPVAVAAGHGHRPGYFAYVPPVTGDSPIPVVVCVHGISREPRAIVEHFLDDARARGIALLAPCFEPPRYDDYQRLGRRGRGERADLALDGVVDHAERFFSTEFDRRFLFGFSGGAQFVHRYVMAHPDRIFAAVLVAAGWYTFPRRRRGYPHGLRIGGAISGVEMNPRCFLQVPQRVLVGSRDTERDAGLRKTARVDRQQGMDRVTRAREWVADMRRVAERIGYAPRVDLELLPGAGHDFADTIEAGLVSSVFEFFDEHR